MHSLHKIALTLKQQRIAVPLFFLLLFVTGLLAFEGYGISWDEPNQYGVGERAYSYVFGEEPWPEEHSKRFYGTSFELPAAAITHILGLSDSRDIFLLRHFLTFLYFFTGVFFYYKLATFHFGSWRMGLIGALFLVLSPRIFADAFYNSKDIPNLAFFILGMYTLVRFLEEKTPKRLVLHAFGSALACTIRLSALFIPLFTIVFLLRDGITGWKRGETDVGRQAGMLISYTILFLILFITFWPFLWENPVARFLESYRFMSGQGASSFYFGETTPGKVPWHYTFVWVGITTPLLYTLLFTIGLGRVLRDALRSPVRWMRENTRTMLFLLWFLLPVVAVIVTGSGIFDAWRHLFFIYGGFLMIALQGLHALFDVLRQHGTRVMRIAAAVIMISSMSTALWMIRYHPIQNMYFALPSGLVEGKFELDYWGLSFRPAIEWVLTHDPDPVIPLFANISPGYSTALILPEEDRRRIVYTDEASAKYVLDNFRSRYLDPPRPQPEVHAIYSSGIKVIGVYRMQ